MASVDVFIDKIITPCPDCGGTVQLMALYDHPPELGGDWEYDFCLCINCKREWLEHEAPIEFSSPDEKYWLTEYIAINGIGEL